MTTQNSPSFRNTNATDVALHTPAKSKWRLVIIVAAVLIATLASRPILRFVGSKASIPLSELRFAKIERKALRAETSAYGLVVAKQSPALYATSAGVVQFAVEAGASVKQDEILATILSPELQNQLQQGQSALAALRSENARLALTSDRAVLDKTRARNQAQINERAALRELQRAQAADKLQAISQLELLRAEDTLEAAKLTSAHAADDLALEIRARKLDASQRSELLNGQVLLVAELDRKVAALTLKAPFAGQVGTRMVADRASVQAGTALVSLVDLAELELEVPVGEQMIGKIFPGMAALIELDDQKLPGEVRLVSAEVTGGQLMTRVKFSGQTPDLKQNQRLLTRIVLGQELTTLVAPRGAFVQAEGGNFAWQRQGDRLVRVPIRLGIVGPDEVEILAGLKQGDEIATNEMSAAKGASEMLILN